MKPNKTVVDNRLPAPSRDELRALPWAFVFGPFGAEERGGL